VLNIRVDPTIHLLKVREVGGGRGARDLLKCKRTCTQFTAHEGHGQRGGATLKKKRKNAAGGGYIVKVDGRGEKNTCRGRLRLSKERGNEAFSSSQNR